jgi:uncharacterized damage-inducible protein DinB
MKDDPQKSMKLQLADYLCSAHAHVGIADALSGVGEKHINIKPPGFAHTLWEELEHIRLAQRDIIDFILDPDYQSPDWPQGYWPEEGSQATMLDWLKSVKSVKEDLWEFISLITDPETDLLKKIPHGSGQTILREALLMIDHNSYHLGQILDLRRALGIWQ